MRFLHLKRLCYRPCRRLYLSQSLRSVYQTSSSLNQEKTKYTARISANKIEENVEFEELIFFEDTKHFPRLLPEPSPYIRALDLPHQSPEYLNS